MAIIKSKAIHAVGKRKTSIARIWMKPGKGVIIVNKRSIDEYFLRPTSKMILKQPLELTGNVDGFDITINVIGGGLTGQAGAIRHAISRALAGMNPEHRKTLKTEGLITRDARKKERKKYGLKSARRRFQFSKR
ncbi:MAG: 30S ribosomal protein S9 [Proteobacteria bacterium]|nr:30S ribosomal protein S9 [Pseudomonadota bacterium]